MSNRCLVKIALARVPSWWLGAFYHLSGEGTSISKDCSLLDQVSSKKTDTASVYACVTHSNSFDLNLTAGATAVAAMRNATGEKTNDPIHRFSIYISTTGSISCSVNEQPAKFHSFQIPMTNHTNVCFCVSNKLAILCKFIGRIYQYEIISGLGARSPIHFRLHQRTNWLLRQCWSTYTRSDENAPEINTKGHEIVVYYVACAIFSNSVFLKDCDRTLWALHRQPSKHC